MKILFAPQSTSLTHVGRCLSLAKRLHELGHEIVFVGEPRFIANEKYTGERFFKFVEQREIPASIIIRKTQAGQGLHKSEVIEEIVKSGIEILKQEKPHFVVVDLRPTMLVAAKASGVPAVSLLNVRWFPKLYARPFPYPKTLRVPVAWQKEIEGLDDKSKAEKVVWLNQAAVAEPFKPVLEKFNLPVVDYYCDLLEGDLNLFLDTAFFAPTINLPPNFHQVGPIFWHPPWEDPEWIDEIPSSPPAVYVSFGSFAAEELFVRTAEALVQLGLPAVIHTMRQEPKLPELPSNIRVVKEMKDEKIYAKVGFVVNQAGNQTVYESILGESPMLCIASHVGQEFVAEDVARLRLGLKLTVDEALDEKDTIKNALKQLLDRRDDFVARVKLAKEDLVCYDGLATAVERIRENFE